jgi:5-methylcytosine-specific restriction endonuclease McrA
VRKDWKHWVDADHDCQNTRNEVLIAESEVSVEFTDERRCKVKRGRWTCPYTGRTVTDPGELDIDHLVPLENAHRSGGWRWSRERKEAYANDLDDPGHLVAVVASANRQKGSKPPEEWLPRDEAFVCQYVRAWRSVKARWGLAMTNTELRKVEVVLAACAVRGGPSGP